MLNGGLGICGEVDEQPELAASKAEVVHQLSTMLLCQCLHSLDLDYDLPITMEVGDVRLFDRLSFIEDAEFLLGVKRNAA